MASQSPSITADAAALADPASYLAGWAALAELVDRGYSWSGHERHCVFVNRGGAAGFADVSALSGLDFADDGRACVALDLDGDGDRDLVFKNRSGPQLRMLTNVHAPGRALAVRLRGVAGSHNTGAIGARVELVAGDRRLVRCVTAGDGYLGQASRWLHFGLAGVPAPERLRVCWPGGVEQEFAVPPAARRLVLVQGGAAAVEGASPSLVLPAADAASADPSSPAAETIVLREPLPLSPTLRAVAFRGAPKRPVLLGVWSPGCEVCAQTIGALAAAPALLAAADFDVVYLGLQAGSEQAVAALRFRELLGEDVAAAAILRQRPASSDVRQALAAVLAAVLGRGELTTPGAFLIDAEGRLQVCYFGPIEVEQLVGDVERFGRAKAADNRRSHRGGSWAFYVPRAWQPVVAAFAQRGLPRDAGFYARLRDR